MAKNTKTVVPTALNISTLMWHVRDFGVDAAGYVSNRVERVSVNGLKRCMAAENPLLVADGRALKLTPAGARAVLPLLRKEHERVWNVYNNRTLNIIELRAKTDAALAAIEKLATEAK